MRTSNRTSDPEGTAQTDVLVVGAGLAGLHTATLLARQGHDVLLVERRAALAGAIRTTGIFVRKTLDDFPLPTEHLGPPIRRMVLYPPGMRRPVSLVSARDEFRVGDMAPLYEAAAAVAQDAGVRMALGTRYAGRQDDTYHLLGRGARTAVRARFVVGADGARSRVARDLALDRNRRLLIGAEEVFEVSGSEEPPTFHCVLDPSLAPGYLAWVVNDGRHAHVGVAGYAERFPDGLRRAMERFAASAPGLPGGDRPSAVERRGGPIPVGGVLRRISCPDGLLVGDAAGAVSPLTAGGLDPCLRLSEHAAEILHDALRTGRRDVLGSYDGAALRAGFRGRLTLRRALAQVRTPAAAKAAFVLMRTPLGRAAAGRVLFGDRSFPEPARRPSPEAA
ncbi:MULTISPECIES: NAD(P)/FAD-dependent oxidoreductase [unclassified Streptomyces]|uniref:FAD-dependent oxidoreductase n=1 Tax=unclassified Streptomyces TaxID=2593676 RepID=UPI0025B50179|nr:MULTISPECIES: NAD(P)/FAD-dependent oxidoreductase [unclassified Streptomyces]MDN3244543.1 NAD(P)/FAD-dependent oxidoreductase [Streptomyces sp. ZSW22]MDN3253638.1 NAD(P)/FAD-dependent oxidoreductase [Streptomyces sp. MA25(2023)]